MSWHSCGGEGELNITALLENKLWTVGLQSRELSGSWVEGEKEAVVCTSVVWSPRRSAVVTRATSMCTSARHSCSILKNVGRKMCVLCQKFRLLEDLFRLLGSHWCYLTLFSIPEWLDAFLLTMPDPVFEVCSLSFERKIQSCLSSCLPSHHFLHDAGFPLLSACCQSCWWVTSSCHLQLP